MVARRIRWRRVYRIIRQGQERHLHFLQRWRVSHGHVRLQAQLFRG